MYVDGSSNWKNRKGGAGVYMKFENQTKKLSAGSFENTTISQMELLAMILGLRIVRKDYPVIIYSDSLYVVNSCNTWISQWKKDGSFCLRKNKELLEILHTELLQFGSNLKIKHVKGHSGVDGNEVADLLAKAGYHNSRKQDLFVYLSNYI